MALTTLNLYDNILRLTNEIGDVHDVYLDKYIDTLPVDRVVAAALQNDGKTLVLTQPNTDAIVVDLESILASNSCTVVNSVAGKVGAVSLVKTDVGLGNVDNTADLDKPVSNPTKEYLSDCLSFTPTLPEELQVRGDYRGRGMANSTDMDAGFEPVIMMVACDIAELNSADISCIRPSHIQAAYGVGVKRDTDTGITTVRVTGNLEVGGCITGIGGTGASNYTLCCVLVPCYTDIGSIMFRDTLGVACSATVRTTIDGVGNICTGFSSLPNNITACDIVARAAARSLNDVADYIPNDVVDGTVLAWNATGKCWEPRPVSGVGTASTTWGTITGNIVNQSDLSMCFNNIGSTLSHMVCSNSDFYNCGESDYESYLMVGSKIGTCSAIIRSSGIKAYGDCYMYKCNVHAKAFVGTDLCVSGSVVVNGVTLDPDGFTETTTIMSYVPATKTISYINEEGTTYIANLSSIAGTTIEDISYTSETDVLKFTMSDTSIKTVLIPTGVAIEPTTTATSAVCYDGTQLVGYVPTVVTALPFSAITGSPSDNVSLNSVLATKVTYSGNNSTVGTIPMVIGCNCIGNSPLVYTATGFTSNVPIVASNTNDHELISTTYDTLQSRLEIRSKSCVISTNIPVGVKCMCQLLDTNTAGASTGDVLTWNSFTGKWEATAICNTYTTTQVRSEVFNSTTWVVNHNLGYTPNICVYCCTGAGLFTEVVKVSNNQSVVHFVSTTQGYVEYTV